MEINKNLKRLVTFTLIFLISVIGVGFSKVSAATDEVSLYSTRSNLIDAAAGFTVHRLTAQIKVKNLAYNKKVTIHFKDFYHDDWQDWEAKYESGLNGEYELWTAEPIFIGGIIEFAIKYEVNGQVYWDNNGGKNYIVDNSEETRYY